MSVTAHATQIGQQQKLVAVWCPSEFKVSGDGNLRMKCESVLMWQAKENVEGQII
jgi:hypothetical protein